MKTLEELRKEYQKYLETVSVQGFRTTSSVRSTYSSPPYGDIKLFEINPRFSGAQVIRAMAGVNGPEILIDNWLEEKKSYPITNGRFVAFWYADYLYTTNSKYEELKTVKKIKRNAIGVPLL